MVAAGTVGVYDETYQMETRILFNLVVLAVPIVPSATTGGSVETLRVPADRSGLLSQRRLRVSSRGCGSGGLWP